MGNSVRWTILTRVAAVDELSYKELEQILGLARPTVSYHLKALVDARLLRVRKAGRERFYGVKTDVITAAIGELRALMPAPATALPSVIENVPADLGAQRMVIGGQPGSRSRRPRYTRCK